MNNDQAHIRDLLRAKGLRFGWVAEQMGISPSMLTHLLAGERRWTPKHRQAIARVLDMPEETLFFLCENRLSDDKSHKRRHSAA